MACENVSVLSDSLYHSTPWSPECRFKDISQARSTQRDAKVETSESSPRMGPGVRDRRQTVGTALLDGNAGVRPCFTVAERTLHIRAQTRGRLGLTAISQAEALIVEPPADSASATPIGVGPATTIALIIKCQEETEISRDPERC